MSRVDGKYGGFHGGAPRGVMSRGEFLRLAGGAAAGLSLFGGIGAFGAGEARAAEILGGGFPIGVWYPPPPDQTTVERYREIADAGFNFVIGGNMADREGAESGGTIDMKNEKSLEVAAANDLRFILHDGRLRQAINGTSSGMRSFASGSGAGSPMRELRLEEESDAEEGENGGENRAFDSSGDARTEIQERIAAILDTHGDSPALAGINLYDEPNTGVFGNVAHAKDILRELDGGLLPYVNVWPSHTSSGAMGASNYPTYLSRYMSDIDPKVLSFDHYPLLEGRAHTKDYFYNWEVIRRYSLRSGVPSWVFIQSVDFDGSAVGLTKRRRPSYADLLWQINVSLAYGAKGIQYFTYWTPENAPSEYGQALISKDGTRSPLYGHAQNVNGYLSAVGRRLSPMNSELVVHAGVKKPPLGTRLFRRDKYVSSVGGSPVVMGWFRRPGANRKTRFLFVVNRSSFAKSSSVLAMHPKMGAVSRFVPATGSFARVRMKRRRKRKGARKEPRKLRVKLAPGAAQLFELRRR